MRFLCLSIVCLIFGVFNSEATPLKGFNTNAFLYNFSFQQFSDAYRDTLDRLQPDVLRFPGGAIANKYHLSKSGYGQESVFDKKTNQNYIVEFVRLVKSMKKPPKVLLVINMYEHFHKPTLSDWDLVVENIATILYLKKQGVEIAGVELGNEFYIYPVIRGWDIKLPNKMKKKLENSDSDEWWPYNYKKYNRLAKLYHTAIKKIDPQIPTGIPMGSSMNKNHKRWNAFAQHMDFSDAYIQHWYGQVSDAKDENKAVESFNRFFDRVKDNILALKKTGKQVWITEWNGIDFGYDNSRNMHWKQTPTHTQFNREVQDLFDDLQVDITIYHRLSSGKSGDTYNLLNVENNRITANPTYWEFLKPPFKSSR